MGLTLRQEVVLSYLVGLAPPGTPLTVPGHWIEADIRGMKTQQGMRHVNYQMTLRGLMKRGAIETVEERCGRRTRVIRVLKRPEAFSERAEPCAK
jgi:hypothetical protein